MTNTEKYKGKYRIASARWAAWDYGASRRSLRCEEETHISAGAKERNVNATEGVRCCFSYGDLFAAEGDAAASGRGGERDEPTHGEVALF